MLYTVVAICVGFVIFFVFVTSLSSLEPHYWSSFNTGVALLQPYCLGQAPTLALFQLERWSGIYSYGSARAKYPHNYIRTHPPI